MTTYPFTVFCWPKGGFTISRLQQGRDGTNDQRRSCWGKLERVVRLGETLFGWNIPRKILNLFQSSSFSPCFTLLLLQHFDSSLQKSVDSWQRVINVTTAGLLHLHCCYLDKATIPWEFYPSVWSRLSSTVHDVRSSLQRKTARCLLGYQIIFVTECDAGDSKPNHLILDFHGY